MIVRQNEAVELAFVLKKNISNQHKISVLTQKHGKIYLLENSAKKSLFLWPGMLISFILQDIKYQKQNNFVCNNIEILLSPDKNFDLNWIHHVLELCYYFIPLQDSCDKIFSFVFNCFLFAKLELIFEKHVFLIRSISLLKFLEIAGCYLSSDFRKYLYIYEELTNFLINIADKQKEELLRTNLEQISDLEIKKITKWIFSCISQHPCSKLFKTCFKNNFSNL